jgi:asparagine synthase (glutamine-hydrolysing)
MIRSMLHDRFDTYDTRCIPELGCYLGWVGEGAADSTPMREEGGRVLVFAGENFSDTKPAGLLSTSGASEDRLLRELNGWFAGVLVDTDKKEVLLFNDRFGLHRIYYTQSRGTLAFATEAKGLLASHPRTRRLNPQALGEFVAVGSVLRHRTLFEDVFLVPGGSAWVIRNADTITKRSYFAPEEWENQPHLTDGDFLDRLTSTLSTVVPRYFGGARRVAVSLTGGVDTRVVMAFAGQGRDLTSYTFGGMYRDCLDVRIARDVAQACGYRHEVLRLGPEFLRNFGEYGEKTIWISDGTLDVGAAHEVYLNEVASALAPVRVTGNYGSEILRGASALKPLAGSARLFHSDFAPYIKEAHQSLSELTTAHHVSFAAFHEIPWHLAGRLHVAQSQLTMRSPYTDNDLVALSYQAPLHVRQALKLWNGVIARQNPVLAAIPTDRGHFGNAPSTGRLPSRLYNYLLFKAEWYHQAGMPHWLARVDRRVPRALHPLFFVGSHKIEHYRTWFRDDLFEYLRSVVLESGEIPYVDQGRAAQVVVAHREGRGNFVADITRLVTIALIQKLFTREASSGADHGRQIEFHDPAPDRTTRQAGAVC